LATAVPRLHHRPLLTAAIAAAVLLAGGCSGTLAKEEVNVEVAPPEGVAAAVDRLSGSVREARVSENNQGMCGPGDVLFVEVQQSVEGGEDAFNETTTNNVIKLLEAIRSEGGDDVMALDYRAYAKGVDRYGRHRPLVSPLLSSRVRAFVSVSDIRRNAPSVRDRVAILTCPLSDLGGVTASAGNGGCLLPSIASSGVSPLPDRPRAPALRFLSPRQAMAGTHRRAAPAPPGRAVSGLSVGDAFRESASWLPVSVVRRPAS